MARRSGITPGNRFHRLPLNLSREIALFLGPFRINHIQELVALVRASPICFLKISLGFVLTAEDRVYIAALVHGETYAALTFDVSVCCAHGRLDTELVRILLSASRVESLALHDVSINFLENLDVFNDFVGSKNRAHIVKFGIYGDCWERTQRTVLEGAERIADLLRNDKCLVGLTFGWNRFEFDPNTLRRAEFWTSLGSNRSLCSLRLCGAGLDAEDAVLLCDALISQGRIESLNIAANKIGDEGVLAIAQLLQANTTLRVLVQSTVGATSRGGIAMAVALCQNTTLEHLDMATNKLHPISGKAIASMLQVNSSLRVLDLDCCALQEEGCRYSSTL